MKDDDITSRIITGIETMMIDLVTPVVARKALHRGSVSEIGERVQRFRGLLRAVAVHLDERGETDDEAEAYVDPLDRALEGMLNRVTDRAIAVAAAHTAEREARAARKNTSRPQDAAD